jgi:predicted RNase H-like nuclease
MSLFKYGKEEEVQSVIGEGGMKCVALKMKEKEDREEKVKENGKTALIFCLCQDPDGDGILTRMKEGWKGEEIMREMMLIMEEEDVKKTLIMSNPNEISKDDVLSFNYGLGMCLHAK